MKKENSKKMDEKKAMSFIRVDVIKDFEIVLGMLKTTKGAFDADLSFDNDLTDSYWKEVGKQYMIEAAIEKTIEHLARAIRELCEYAGRECAIND